MVSQKLLHLAFVVPLLFQLCVSSPLAAHDAASSPAELSGKHSRLQRRNSNEGDALIRELTELAGPPSCEVRLGRQLKKICDSKRKQVDQQAATGVLAACCEDPCTFSVLKALCVDRD